jgi:hypothetical protein
MKRNGSKKIFASLRKSAFFACFASMQYLEAKQSKNTVYNFDLVGSEKFEAKREKNLFFA